MFRRRRTPEREIAFSFDSFLDVVTNVVGIILRLILVAWVGAKAYKGPPAPALPELPTFEAVAELPAADDPLAAELERQRRALTDAQAELTAQVQRWQNVQQQREPTAAEIAALVSQRQKLEDHRLALERSADQQGKGTQALVLSLAELEARGKKLTEEVEALRKAPPVKQSLRYRTPVSRPLQTEELLFELQGGKVAFIDIGAMLDEVRQEAREKAEQLRSQFDLAATTNPVGPFKLRYTLEREREMVDGLAPGAAPVDRNRFRISLAGWEVQPIVAQRGEPAEEAVKAGSAFRRVIDAIDPAQTAVTFCVYPDSFPLYRQLRDYLHERDMVVAGRPLPEGTPIASSRNGSASRGQ